MSTATVSLDGGAVVTSALGLGCAGLFREPSAAARRRLLDAALAAGIRHFDVAPMYGLGLAERELGRFARGKRDRIVIATKFGIDATPAARLVSPIQAPLRRRGPARPGDARAGIAGRVLYRSGGYDARAARAGLERSLKRLGTDYVDILFLHDPRPGDVRSDDVRSYLEDARSSGAIRSWGIAAEPPAAVDAEQALGVTAPTLQVRDDILLRSRRGLGRAGIAFGVLSRALPAVLAHVRADAAVAARWRDAVGLDCTVAESTASLLLRAAVEDDEGPVLFSSIRVDRIADTATDVPADAVRAFRRLVESELSPR